VVNRDLEAWTVVAHLALAMIVVATLVGLTVHLAGWVAPAGLVGAGTVRLTTTTALAAYGLMLLGSWVTGRGAGLAYRDWPLMGGRLVPTRLGDEARLLQFAHRGLAAGVGLLLVIVVVRARRSAAPAVRRLAHAMAVLFLLEVGVGGLNVFSRLHAASVTTHLALAALTWTVLVALWAVAGGLR